MHKNCFKLKTALFFSSLVVQLFQLHYIINSLKPFICSQNQLFFNTHMATYTIPTFKTEALCLVTYVYASVLNDCKAINSL